MTNTDAKILALEQQRNHALNQVVNLTADLAMAHEQIARLTALADKAIARVAELEADAKDHDDN